MRKLPTLTPKQIIKVLEKRGFQFDRSKGSHHLYYHPESHRRATVPVHKKDLPKGTLFEILKEAGISKDELIDLL